MKLLAALERSLRPRGARLGSLFLAGAGAVGVVTAILPGPPDINRPGLAAVGAAAVVTAAVAWHLPWERWPWWSNLTVLTAALALLAVGNVFNGSAPYSYGGLYVVAFVWVGMAHRPGTSLLMSPVLVLAYLLPLLALPGDFGTKAASLLLVLPTCVMVGELLARARQQLQRTEDRRRAYSAELEAANVVLIERDRDLRAVLAELRRVEAERRSLLDQTVSSVEEERKRIAVELHDGPIQHLTALEFGLESAKTRLERGDLTSAAETLTRAQEVAREDVVALRHLMKDLRPPVLDDYGLATALRDYVTSFADGSALTCGVDVDLPARLDPTLETVLYRVAQEALSNVAKHARARRAALVLRVDGDVVRLEVRDDGIGFDPSMGGNGSMTHYGLMGMRQRVEMVGGTWEILPNPGGGTVIHVRVPLVGTTAAERVAGPRR